MTEAPAGEGGAAARVWRRIRPWVPWGSLAVGVVGAFLMERSPDRAWMVLAAAIGAWALLATVAVLGGMDASRLPRLHGRAVRWGMVSALIASQSLVQLCLFFALPFYARAASLLVGHVLFFTVYAAAVVLASWDPFYEWVFGHRWASLALLGFASFTGLACVLPVMGLSLGTSLLAAGLLTGLGVPLLERLRRPAEAWTGRARLQDAAVLLAFPAFAFFGGATFVPPAPLSLARAEIGTRVEGKWVADPITTFDRAPPRVVCATAIRAPRGLKDGLQHEWRHDGALVDTIPLEVRGGRKLGFRTWSVKANLGPDPAGRWSCRAVTDTGQELGQVRFSIRSGDR